VGSDWRDCIITLIDLVDAKEDAAEGVASVRMRELHRLVTQELGGGALGSVAHAYVWNDSVLALSYVDQTIQSYETALRDVRRLKGRIDQLRPSYAIAVKGQPFPPADDLPAHLRVTVLAASSWAMANCFLIEDKLRKYRATWYVDAWIADKLSGTLPAFRKGTVAMLPKKRRRSIHLYKRDLWNEGEG
jgi:hypothetical protein